MTNDGSSFVAEQKISDFTVPSMHFFRDRIRSLMTTIDSQNGVKVDFMPSSMHQMGDHPNRGQRSFSKVDLVL